MWLLSTDRAELHYFPTAEQVAETDGYAILSHVWDEEEQSFQDLQSLASKARDNDYNPRDLTLPKIQECCKLAEKHGHKWVWIDTCCIDKSSSAELSEAINSMFRLYTLASICFAYLKDVASEVENNGDRLFEKHFMASKWHTRGWTLQELIAPKIVLFVSSSWDILGTKADLATNLEIITKIPAAVLTLEKDFRDMSVAQRMCWAAKRRTTRVEDVAYSLFGIFDVNLAVLYGEGSRAFQRLQEEIMRRSPDTSLFAWGSHYAHAPWITNDLDTREAHSHLRTSFLFAHSPNDFAEAQPIHLLQHVAISTGDILSRVSDGPVLSSPELSDSCNYVTDDDSTAASIQMYNTVPANSELGHESLVEKPQSHHSIQYIRTMKRSSKEMMIERLRKLNELRYSLVRAFHAKSLDSMLLFADWLKLQVSSP